MGKFRLSRKQKKEYARLDFMGILNRYQTNRIIKRNWRENNHHPRLGYEMSFRQYLKKNLYNHFEYTQSGYDMLKAVRREIRPYKNSLWGTSYVDADKLTPYMEGNGLQLVRVVTLSSRPFGYLVRIDSSHNVNADDFDMEIMLQNIEEYYGCGDDYEEMEIDGKSVYVYNDDIDKDGNILEDAYIREDMPFYWDGGSWNTQALTKIDHTKTLYRILSELQKTISEDFYSTYGLCHFINEYSPTGTAEEIYRLIELATGIDLDNVGYQWNRFYESDFENRLEYRKAHYQPRLDIINQTLDYYRKEAAE